VSMGRKPFTSDQIEERRKKLITQGGELALQIGRVPHAKDFKKENGTYSYTAIRNVFGSWNLFLKECNLKENKATYVSKEDLIWLLLSLKRLLDKTPTKSEYTEYAKKIALVVPRYP